MLWSGPPTITIFITYWCFVDLWPAWRHSLNVFTVVWECESAYFYIIIFIVDHLQTNIYASWHCCQRLVAAARCVCNPNLCCIGNCIPAVWRRTLCHAHMLSPGDVEWLGEKSESQRVYKMVSIDGINSNGWNGSFLDCSRIGKCACECMCLVYYLSHSYSI